LDGSRAGLTGRGVRVAVIDSGVHGSHPHIGRVAGGVTIGEYSVGGSYSDLLGHGTAVMAAIQEKAPDADYFAVRVFQRELRTNVDILVRAIEWCIGQQMHVVNLSLGTTNPSHAERMRPLIAQAGILVAAREVDGEISFPGSLPEVIGVGVDWNLPRENYTCRNGVEFYASGYPRPIPGVPKEWNLNGISFAVANMTGFVAQICERLACRTYDRVRAELIAQAART
jgi:hypothetical protein